MSDRYLTQIDPRDTFIRSRPIRVRMVGLEGDTHSMQQMGWSFSAFEDVASMRVQVLAKHERNRLIAWSTFTHFDYFNRHQSVESLVLDFPYVASRLQVSVHSHDPFDPASFQPVDMSPSVQQATTQYQLEDLQIFNPAPVRAEEIVLPEPEIKDLLAEILKKQDKKRMAKLKERIRMREGVSPTRSQVYATITGVEAA